MVCGYDMHNHQIEFQPDDRWRFNRVVKLRLQQDRRLAFIDMGHHCQKQHRKLSRKAVYNEIMR